MIRITTRDVGLTQVATIWVGETRAIEFYTGTRHPDYSKDIAEEILAKAICDLIHAHHEADIRFWTGTPGGFHNADS